MTASFGSVISERYYIPGRTPDRGQIAAGDVKRIAEELLKG